LTYFAAALARTPSGWRASELDLSAVTDVDGLVEMLQESTGDEPGSVALAFIEENDEWLGVVRSDDTADPKVFISDSRVAEDSALAAMLYQPPESEVLVDTGDDDSARPPSAEPAGDADLLADLGIPAAELLELCAEEGMLPSDIMTAICERAGCVEELERLREG
jgi:putative tRNA adenosine deaminase-associated protein